MLEHADPFGLGEITFEMSRKNKHPHAKVRPLQTGPAAGTQPVVPTFAMVMHYAVAIPPLIDQLVPVRKQEELSRFHTTADINEAASYVHAKESFLFKAEDKFYFIVFPHGPYDEFLQLVSCFSAMGHVNGQLKEDAISRVIGANLFTTTEVMAALSFLKLNGPSDTTFFPVRLSGIMVVEGDVTSSVRIPSLESFVHACCEGNDFSHPAVFPCGIYSPILDDVIHRGLTFMDESTPKDIHSPLDVVPDLPTTVETDEGKTGPAPEDIVLSSASSNGQGH